MDDIVLPQLPPMPLFDPEKMWVWLDQIRNEAVIADRKRRAEAKPEPEPQRVHQAMICFGDNGGARVYTGVHTTDAMHLVRWTNDGRAWIESKARRGVASDLRRAALWLRSRDETDLAAVCRRAADLLDGGEPC